MAMGIVSDKQFDSALRDSNPESNNSVPTITPEITGEVNDIKRGRGTGSISVPNSLRNIIGEESTVNGRQSAVELAQSFGISPSSVSAYGVGATSTKSYNERPNLPIINKAKDRVVKRAHHRLMGALKHITDEKLESANAKDLAGIAKDMSAVVKSMEPETPKGPTENSNGPTFVFYAPQIRKEESYEVVHMKE